jgi:hypothetical protein
VQRGRYAALAGPLFMHVATGVMKTDRRLRSHFELIFRRHRRLASESPAVIPVMSARLPHEGLTQP